MRILLTGASGFIGSHLGPRLVDEGYEVLSFVRHVSRRDVPVSFGKSISVDIADFGNAESKVAEYQPEIIVNLAAQSLVAYSFDHPIEVQVVDYLAAINLMEAARKHCKHLELFLQASTSEVYGYQEQFPIKESAEKKPHCSYSIAKHAADCYAEYLGKAYSFPYLLLRNFNTYGERHSVRRITERTIAQMCNGGPVRLGDPDAIRDFLFVDDSTHAYMEAINRRVTGMELNVCTGIGISIRDWVSKIADLMEYTGKIEFNSTFRRPADIPILIGSNARVRKVFNWKPRFTHETGLKETISRVTEYVNCVGWSEPVGGWS